MLLHLPGPEEAVWTQGLQAEYSNISQGTRQVLKVFWIFKNIFEILHNLNDSDEKTKMLKTLS